MGVNICVIHFCSMIDPIQKCLGRFSLYNAYISDDIQRLDITAKNNFLPQPPLLLPLLVYILPVLVYILPLLPLPTTTTKPLENHPRCVKVPSNKSVKPGEVDVEAAVWKGFWSCLWCLRLENVLGFFMGWWEFRGLVCFFFFFGRWHG